MLTKLYQNEQCVLMDRWQVYDFCQDTRVQDVPEKVYQMSCRDENDADYTVFYRVNPDSTIGDLWCVCRYDGDYDQFFLTWMEGYSKKYTIEKKKETVVLYTRDEATLEYFDQRLKNDDCSQSTYKLCGDYWVLPCRDADGTDYKIFFEQNENENENATFDDLTCDNIFVILKDYTMCDDWRICSLWSLDDPIDYVLENWL